MSDDIVTIRYNNGRYEIHDHIENADYTRILLNGVEVGFCVDDVLIGLVRKIVSEYEVRNSGRYTQAKRR